ncbi:hypothetical protein E4U52_008307, partial [Claviceps spartinae]
MDATGKSTESPLGNPLATDKNPTTSDHHLRPKTRLRVTTTKMDALPLHHQDGANSVQIAAAKKVKKKKIILR